MPRWITVGKPFDYTWPSGAITAFGDKHLGDHFLKDEMADFAVEQGYATEGKADEASRSSKGKRAKNAKAADNRPDDAVAQPDLADADRAAGGQPVDPDAE